MAHPAKQSKSNQKLLADGAITASGMEVILNGERFPINYPKEIWAAYDQKLKEILLDSLVHSTTFYVPQILEQPEIHYSTNRPVSEAFLYKNGIYDMPYCANVDGKSSNEYLLRFFNTRYYYASEEIRVPDALNYNNSAKSNVGVIGFSMGKESLLNFALCKELGITPVLVSVIEPSHKYEYHHKKSLIEAFEKEFSQKIHVIDFGPGWFKEGRYWGIQTELGWGLHVTEYSMLMLPFLSYYDARFMISGNEQSCHDVYIDKENVLIYRAGFEQHRDWTHQQGILLSLLLGRRADVISLVEPLYEIAETKILHSRYPEIAKYQFSCFAVDDNAKETRWCHNCNKCAYMFALFSAFGVETSRMGFREDLFSGAFAKLYDSLFTRSDESHFYGSQGELGLAVYYALKRGARGDVIDRFRKELLGKFEAGLSKYESTYMGIHPTKNIPGEFKEKILKIYGEELG